MPPTARGRLVALDGLRGLAAVVVLVHHCLLLFPPLADPYYGRSTATGWPEIAVETPLHLAWAGTEAVYLFFVLSGLVLVLSTGSKRFGWERYFPSRLIRLYLPVAGAVAFAALTIALVPRTGLDEGSIWLLRRPATYEPGDIAQDLLLVGGASGTVSPLWSLQWEILFSLLLPVYVMIARRVPPFLLGVACIALPAIGMQVGSGALTYLPMFGIGAALAAGWERISSVTERWTGLLASLGWLSALCLALLAIGVRWTGVPGIGQLPRPVSLVIALAGVVVLVVTAARWRPLSALLSLRLAAWLGAISFSLYLVHEPIVLATEFAIGSASQAILIAVPLSFFVAWLFLLVVERPSHRIAARVKSGGSVPDAAQPAPASAVTSDERVSSNG